MSACEGWRRNSSAGPERPAGVAPGGGTVLVLTREQACHGAALAAPGCWLRPRAGADPARLQGAALEGTT